MLSFSNKEAPIAMAIAPHVSDIVWCLYDPSNGGLLESTTPTQTNHTSILLKLPKLFLRGQGSFFLESVPSNSMALSAAYIMRFQPIV